MENKLGTNIRTLKGNTRDLVLHNKELKSRDGRVTVKMCSDTVSESDVLGRGRMYT